MRIALQLLVNRLEALDKDKFTTDIFAEAKKILEEDQ